MNTIKIEMIHDLVCSWCAIGYGHLRQALEQLGDTVNVELHYLPFELNPGLGSQGVDIVKHLHDRLGWSEQRVMEYREDLVPRGLAAGIHIDFSRRTHYYNSFDAHCMMHWASKVNAQSRLHEALLRAYHTEGRDLNDRKVLLDIVAATGLDTDAARRALENGELVPAVHEKMLRARSWNITTVPAFVFNEQFFVTGSNSVEFFRGYLLALSQNDTPPVLAA